MYWIPFEPAPFISFEWDNLKLKVMLDQYGHKITTFKYRKRDDTVVKTRIHRSIALSSPYCGVFIIVISRFLTVVLSLFIVVLSLFHLFAITFPSLCYHFSIFVLSLSDSTSMTTKVKTRQYEDKKSDCTMTKTR